MSMWQVVQSSPCVAATSSFFPDLAWCVLWQEMQLIPFLSCSLAAKESRVCSLEWQVRHILLTAAGSMLGGLAMSVFIFESLCLVPSPWQLSQVDSEPPTMKWALLPWTSLTKSSTTFRWHWRHLPPTICSAVHTRAAGAFSGGL